MGVFPLLLAVSLAQLDGGAALEAASAADAGVLAAPPVVAVPDVAQEAPKAPPFTPVQVRLKLHDGQVLSGKMVARAPDGTVTLDLGVGQVVVAGALIEELEEDVRSTLTKSGEVWFQDPNRTRYLYGPSAMMLKKNELYFSQNELILSTLNWGVTDWLGVQIGGAIPLWFIPPLPQGFNLLLAIKGGGSLTDTIHLATGLQALWLPGQVLTTRSSVPVIGLWFATATYGTPNAHVTASFALPFNLAALGTATPVLASPIVTLSGNYRLTRAVSLVSENWLITGFSTTNNSHVMIVPSLAVRVMGEHVAADIGLIVLASDRGVLVPVPLPWLTFTYNFF